MPMSARLHYGVAGIALITGAFLGTLTLLEEAALCALFSLACVHQAQNLATEHRLGGLDRILFMVLRHLDDVRRKLR